MFTLHINSTYNRPKLLIVSHVFCNAISTPIYLYSKIENAKAVISKIVVYLFWTFTVGYQFVILELLTMINGVQNYKVVATDEIGRGIIGPWTIKIKKDGVGTSFQTLRWFCPFLGPSQGSTLDLIQSDQCFITHSPILWF